MPRPHSGNLQVQPKFGKALVLEHFTLLPPQVFYLLFLPAGKNRRWKRWKREEEPKPHCQICNRWRPEPEAWLAFWSWSSFLIGCDVVNSSFIQRAEKKNPNKNQNQEVIGSAGHLQWPLFTHVYRTVFQKRTKRWKGNKIELNKQTASECWVLFQSNWTVSRLNRFFFRVNFENQGQILGKKLLKHLFEYKTNQTQPILLLFTSLTVFLGLCVSVCVHNILITTNIRTENVNVKLWVNVVFHLLGFILVHCEQQKKKKILIWFF